MSSESFFWGDSESGGSKLLSHVFRYATRRDFPTAHSMSQPPSTRATASSTPSGQVKPNGIDLSQPAVPHTLIPEALGFVPQLLLDDVINIANDAVHVGVNAMEEFLQDWAEKRAQRLEAQNRDAASAAAEVEELDKEIEQGLVAFQTLLEYHTDLGFDMFETWARRNIFAFPPHLKLVLPHHEGLDLTTGGKEEDELMGELEELRKQIQMVSVSFFVVVVVDELFFHNLFNIE